jgi:hypothetical protein
MLHMLIRQFPGKTKIFFYGLFLAAFMFVSIISLKKNLDVVLKRPTLFREMANVVAEKVDNGNRVLIAPYFAFRNVYWETKYIPAEYIYRLKSPWMPNADTIAKYHIRYLIITKVLWDKAIEAGTTEAWDSTPDIKVTDDIVKSTMDLLYTGLKNTGAKCVFQNNELEIYEIPWEKLKVSSDTRDDDALYNLAGHVDKLRRVVKIRR